MSETAQLYQSTPTISVLGNTGEQVRQLSYYRSEADIKTSLRIQLQRFDARGHLKTLFDPRFSEIYLDKSKGAIANYEQRTSLSGSPLQTFSVDAGMQTGLHDVRGNRLYGIDSRSIEQEYEYDEVGRLIERYEQSKQQEKRLIERFVYGDQRNKTINGINRLIQHTDSAGLEVIGAYSFQGQLLSQRRYFADSKSEHFLEETFYETRWRYNALGQLLNQTDAAGNQRGLVYDVAGQVKSTLLHLYQQKKNVLSSDFNYRANGQLVHESLGNGVGIDYYYEEKTQRLSRLEAIRRHDNKRLYDFNYEYDPVGNVININDRSKASSFYANQQTEAVSHYVYDSFYQLIEASGIESLQAGKETAQLPDVLPLGNADATRCVNYQRCYHYDASGNLDHTKHTGAQRYTMKLSIDTTSNRGIEENKRLTLKQSFDANGNILYLNAGQSALAWDTQNQLKKVTQLERENTSDEECYVYDGNHQRLEKSTVRLSKNQIHTERVRYLPGLEIRERWQTDVEGNNKKLNEVLQVIQGQAGGHSVRILHWQQGQPETIDNDSLRITLTEAFDTHQLELNEKAEVVSYESFYPYGGTAIWATKNQSEVSYKFVRYSGKEKDSTGLYYYGYRYYAPWLNRWLNPDPSGISGGLNLFKMAHNNPITWQDPDGRAPYKKEKKFSELHPVQYDEAGNAFHEINDVFFDLGNGEKYVSSVNVKVFREGLTKRKKDFYLFKGSTQAEKLVISSHGVFGGGRWGESESITELTPDSPTITVLGPHKKMLTASPGLDDFIKQVNNPYAKISYAGIDIFSEQALSKSYKNITGTKTKKAVQNYTLSKLETTYSRQFVKHPLHVNASNVHRSRNLDKGETGFDILTVRKHASPHITSGDVINFAQMQGYKEVIFHFCRSCNQGLDEETINAVRLVNDETQDYEKRLEAHELLKDSSYDLRDTNLLESPINLSWKVIFNLPRFGREKLRTWLGSFSGSR